MQPIALQIGTQLYCNIEGLAHNGEGIARYQGLVLFIGNTAPGDEVHAEIVAVKKNFARARVIKILKSGDARVQPLCPVAAECGGCDWQHVDYDTQLNEKRRMLQHLLKNQAGKVIEGLEIVGSPKVYRYRNRLRVKIQDGNIGFYAKRSHRVINIDDCVIAETGLTEAFKELRKTAVNGIYELQLSKDGQLQIRPSLKNKMEAPFSQTNAAVNQLLISYVLEEVIKAGPEVVYDFYCGLGHLTKQIADALPQALVHGVEKNKEAVQQARDNVKNRPDFDCKSVETYLEQLLSSRRKLSFVPTRPICTILNPPRGGCGKKVMELLAKLGPEVVIYISCHPATFFRDWNFIVSLSQDIGKGSIGLKLASVKAFDMFPHTRHVEIVSVMK